ncbi:site-specific integrase [Riemerella anatipestifer]|uniref:Tyrosine recombinase XerD n=1 Tax=Riemerella anatipestifer TaxID=34085 RepID=A0A1S7DQ90_RIEAN|nr:site-specific integrase [Riemerella anatipestifer]AQY21191.1 Tyrosine recombinase XerD [Riemerella anatipestifer]MBO4234221.1 site-specific integrase [Riemerella anatipestifer]MDY3344240.1 site-specific integrase [Riemerella anatipestifer]MDY3357320.1 site-specific integrase [Riemerella anatipestifer]MDY3528937.1 site-specific integrase [Riemerella anatipestifer]
MKRKPTKSTVRLRKAEFRKEWYVYIESYPVYESNDENPKRVREYLNRSVSSVVFDKNRQARTDENGNISYKPKRDENGIIICKSDLDKETMLFADAVRRKLQKQYDDELLFGDNQELKQKELLEENFLAYSEELLKKRHKNSSDSIRITWKRTIELLKLFAGEDIKFVQIDLKFSEDFKLFLLSAPCNGNKKGTISVNTSATYLSIFKAILKQAFIDGYFVSDISGKIKGISIRASRREYLTEEELNILAKTPCDNDVLKRASLFSALTGLRHSDIQKLKWKEIVVSKEKIELHFTQKKTKGVEYKPISKQALELCGERRGLEDFVFEDLPNSSWISRPLKKWIEKAGIHRNITFHCFRHTFATLQLANGTDIYTVSKMLGHTNVNTTQVYAKLVDEKKIKAAEAIKLNF